MAGVEGAVVRCSKGRSCSIKREEGYSAGVIASKWLFLNGFCGIA